MIIHGTLIKMQTQRTPIRQTRLSALRFETIVADRQLNRPGRERRGY
jgi:hypothetical protein